MNNFKRIYTADGNIIINTNNVISVEADTFGGKDNKTYRILIKTTDGRSEAISYTADQYGDDARDMRDNAIEALTGLNEDD